MLKVLANRAPTVLYIQSADGTVDTHRKHTARTAFQIIPAMHFLFYELWMHSVWRGHIFEKQRFLLEDVNDQMKKIQKHDCFGESDFQYLQSSIFFLL